MAQITPDKPIVIDALTDVDSAWIQLLTKGEQRQRLIKIFKYLTTCRKRLIPSADKIFTFAKYPLDKVKIIIMGVEPGYKISSKIFRHLYNTKIIKQIPKNSSYNSFENWSRQGILFLNLALTKLEMKPHLCLWKE